MTRQKVIVVVLCGLFVLGLGIGLVTTSVADDGPSAREIDILKTRVLRATDGLAKEGVFVGDIGPHETGGGRTCLKVVLANPTRPNVQYLQKRFGSDVCIPRRPSGGRTQICSGKIAAPVPTGPVIVPDVRGLGLEAATNRIIRGRLTYALSCLGERSSKVVQPGRSAPEQAARVVRQCPHPGEPVPPGTEVALRSRALLPGGFEFELSALTPYNTGVEVPCSDGRNVTEER
jgi:hypothetical protein